MKIKIIISIISCLVLSSCEDFLEVAPESSFTVDSFFKNENEITRAVNAAYVKNRAIHESLQWRFGENRSDNTSFQFNPADRGGIQNEEFDEFLMNADNGSIQNYWNEAYDGVTRCTFVLENIDPISFSDPQLKDERRGEVLFLRSWYYFNLVRIYGNIPMPLSTASTLDGALSAEFTAQVSPVTVYDTLFRNIDEAIEVLPVSWDADNVGRATRGAAIMLKAKMHMARQEYAEAIPLLQELETFGYSLLASYKDVFDPANKNHSESIFEIQYSFDLGQGSNYITRFVPYNSGGDLLAFGQLAQSRGGQNQPTQDLIDLYEDNDERLAHNIGFYTPENSTESIPWMKKYAFDLLDIGITNVNWPMFRYADARLMLAECLVEVNGLDQSAIGIVNRIRLRAGVGTISAGSVEDLAQAIQDERRRELAFENHRWFDLVRRGEAEAVMMAHGARQKEQKGIQPSGTISPNAYTNIRTLFAIPNNQVIQFGYDQNIGWE
ncbi:MAG: RagB/SusD family nutrient uptake outer membrane protein [Cyclobacteriaceae bacterium]